MGLLAILGWIAAAALVAISVAALFALAPDTLNDDNRRIADRQVWDE